MEARVDGKKFDVRTGWKNAMAAKKGKKRIERV